MKKIKIQSILTAVAGLFLATSCSSSFLDTEPTDAVSSDQVAVAGNAERLQPYSYVGGGVRCRLCAFFERYCAAEGISPHRVFKGNRLNAFYYGIHVYAVLFADGFRLLYVFETVFAQHAVNFVYSSFIAFKQSHKSQPPFMPFAD